MISRRNINRGYQRLAVWQDSTSFNALTCTLAYKLENGIKKPIESLQYKKEKGEWNDSFIIKESNAAYDEDGFERME